MKRGFPEEEKQDLSNNTMIPKFRQTQEFHHHLNRPQQPPPHHLNPPFSNAAAHLKCQTVEEADNDSYSPTHFTKSNPSPTSANDGATIEVVRRPRGRPPGSKNKPKPPVIITRDIEPSMSPYVLELPAGVDVIDSVTRFCRHRKMGLCVLNGNGAVSNVTLKQPSTAGSTVTFHGRFDVLSISATILPPNVPTSIAIANALANGFTISLAGPQGQVVGGIVIGPLVSAETIYLIAATFNSPTFHRLPLEDDARDSTSAGDGNEGQHQSPAPQTVTCEDSRHPTAESCGISMYSYQPSDVIWAPTARQPQPPSY